ncbi:hypothetical protein HC823_01425, partial [Candidatus Gracilibacteria bacterium]|nr:hypothetical protein [Candidatus Gracilibacteria bacterium]
EESLKEKDVLKKVKIIKTEVDPVTKEHQTPHLKQWTLHTIHVSEAQADDIAEDLSKALEGNDETGYWYADYKNEKEAYIIFPNKVFKIARNNSAGFQKAKEYGMSLGIPEYQVDFSSGWGKNEKRLTIN